MMSPSLDMSSLFKISHLLPIPPKWPFPFPLSTLFFQYQNHQILLKLPCHPIVLLIPPRQPNHLFSSHMIFLKQTTRPSYLKDYFCPSLPNKSITPSSPTQFSIDTTHSLSCVLCYDRLPPNIWLFCLPCLSMMILPPLVKLSSTLIGRMP